ncbi:protein phosphatase 1 regulatory subunit 16A-like isoform X3 [Mytilus californianus]|uniref:protein phosphatase 1 regulatory subunit 16A-like isoform X3 n=1 Tax=Mytilus californianus TaxID=6549 RepID=UPI0022472355|nr:protein phosphatase 1 regulatory subunit 16A-like isoform X3 [Mytilus californianus]
MSDHNDLVLEIAMVEKMSTQERLKHAKKRRSQQLKKFANYEKQVDKEFAKKNKKGTGKKRRPRVKFRGNIMLLESAARGDIEDVRKLLNQGVNPDVTNEDGLTALHQACIDDNEEMLKLLLEYGANVNARDSELWTPLHAAATCGHSHLCKHLITKGAELLSVNADGNMPYDICEDEVTLDYIETEMAKVGITQEEIDERRLIPERNMLNDVSRLAKTGGPLDERGSDGATLLHIAAANGYMQVAEFLLDHHVSVDKRDSDSYQPIHAAAFWCQQDVLELLVKNGADIDAKTRNGETPFDLCEDPEMKQKILDLKDDLENKKASRSSGSTKRAKHQTSRSSGSSNLGSSSTMYSSTSSLNEPRSHGLHHSASIRRSSMRGEKSQLFMKEAKEEAMHFGWGKNDLDEEDKENAQTTNIDDVELIIDDEVDKNRPRSDHQQERHQQEKHQQEKHQQEKPNIIRQEIRREDSERSSRSVGGKDVSRRSSFNKRNQKPDIPQNRDQSVPDKPYELNHDDSQRSQNYDHENSSTNLPNVNSGSSSSLTSNRYPSGTPSLNLSELKKHRSESRSRENSVTAVDSAVQDMFLISLQMKGNKYSSSPSQSKDQHQHSKNNGHNNNTPYFQNESMKKFKAPSSAPVVGGEEKDGCCSIL